MAEKVKSVLASYTFPGDSVVNGISTVTNPVQVTPPNIIKVTTVPTETLFESESLMSMRWDVEWTRAMEEDLRQALEGLPTIGAGDTSFETYEVIPAGWGFGSINGRRRRMLLRAPWGVEGVEEEGGERVGEGAGGGPAVDALLGRGLGAARRLLQGSTKGESVKITARSAEAARAAMDVVEGYAENHYGLTNLRRNVGPGTLATSPVFAIRTDALGGNYGALTHAQSLAGKLTEFDLSASLRSQGFAVTGSAFLGTQTVLPLMPPPPAPPLYLHQIGYAGITAKEDDVGYWSIAIGFACAAVVGWFLYYNGVFCEPYWVKRQKERDRIEREILLEQEQDSAEQEMPKNPLAEFKDVAEIPEYHPHEEGETSPTVKERAGYFDRVFAKGKKTDAARL